uniref:Uncharacterized protein n=1 Tax=Arundo donax TaxID=35708 RepID=A0A0A9DL46_ARUDO
MFDPSPASRLNYGATSLITKTYPRIGVFGKMMYPHMKELITTLFYMPKAKTTCT